MSWRAPWLEAVETSFQDADGKFVAWPAGHQYSGVVEPDDRFAVGDQVILYERDSGDDFGRVVTITSKRSGANGCVVYETDLAR